jgi:hypothetical protein
VPGAIIGGIPNDLIRRVKKAVQDGIAWSDGWEVEFIPAKGKEVGLTVGQVASMRERAATIADGPHLLLFARHDSHARKQDGAERRAITEIIQPYFRLRFLSNAVLALIPANMQDFIQQIGDVLREEMAWRQSILPREVISPLLLPESTFDCSREMWLAGSVAGSIEKIQVAAKQLRGFTKQYWVTIDGTKHQWLDDSNRLFNPYGPRHARAPHPFDWKFSCPLPPGFHYDVTAMRDGAFTVFDRDGRLHAVRSGGYINVDPHGRVRGG